MTSTAFTSGNPTSSNAPAENAAPITANGLLTNQSHFILPTPKKIFGTSIIETPVAMMTQFRRMETANSWKL
jgi:hypothetical protein